MSKKANHQQPSLVGLGLGVVGGILVGRRLAGPRRLPVIKLWQKVMAETRGEVQAAVLAARVQARYDELYAHRPRFDHPALRWHLESNILSGLALYQVLRETFGEQAALAEVQRVFAAWVASRRYPFGALNLVPRAFDVFRRLVRLQMKMRYPPEGWEIEYRDDNSQSIAFDIHRCFYLDVLTAYGAPELTASFCAGDDVLFAKLPPLITWERTTTLGRGGDRCDFCWRYAVLRDNGLAHSEKLIGPKEV